MSLASSQHGDDRLAVAFNPQVQLGREPALTVAQRPDVPSIPDGAVPTGIGRLLVRTDHGRVHEVHVPIHLVPSVGLRLQRYQNLVPYPRCTPAIEPVRHRADWTVVPRQVASERIAMRATPVRCTYNMPFRMRRCSPFSRPVQGFAGGNSGSKRRHCASINSLCLIPSI